MAIESKSISGNGQYNQAGHCGGAGVAGFGGGEKARGTRFKHFSDPRHTHTHERRADKQQGPDVVDIQSFKLL